MILINYSIHWLFKNKTKKLFNIYLPESKYLLNRKIIHYSVPAGSNLWILLVDDKKSILFYLCPLIQCGMMGWKFINMISMPVAALKAHTSEERTFREKYKLQLCCACLDVQRYSKAASRVLMLIKNYLCKLVK